MVKYIVSSTQTPLIGKPEMASKNIRHQMEIWSVQSQSFGIAVQETEKEWQVTMQKIIITGFHQVNEGLSKIEDLMKVMKEETLGAKQQLNEVAQTSEPILLGMTSGNIDGIKSSPSDLCSFQN